MKALWAAMLALSAAASTAAAQNFPSSAGDLTVETVARGLNHPWGLAFLPDGRMLVTERPGRLHIVSADGQVSPPLTGTPHVHDGLLDVALDPRFSEDHLVYLGLSQSFLAPGLSEDCALPNLFRRNQR